MFELMKLPYELDALEPFMSKETLEYHYGKHHAAYVKNLNKLVKGTVFEDTDNLTTIIKNAKGAIFNNAAQVYNHNFFWKSLTPNKSDPVVEGTPKGDLMKDIEKYWGSFEKFKEDFTTQAKTHFGSGWCWFYCDSEANRPVIRSYHDAENPLTLKQKVVPFLVADVWEHAYYIDCRNDRGEYLNNFWKLVNWDFVTKNYEKVD